MLRTFAMACTIAVTNAIKLESTSTVAAAYALDDTTAWTLNENALNAVLGTGEKHSDPVFPNNSDSLGSVGVAVEWKRLSDIYGSS